MAIKSHLWLERVQLYKSLEHEKGTHSHTGTLSYLVIFPISFSLIIWLYHRKLVNWHNIGVPKGMSIFVIILQITTTFTPDGRPYYWQIIASSKRIPIYVVSWFLIQLASYKMNKTKIFIFPIWKILTMKCMV